MLVFDLHVHTINSGDSRCEVKDAINSAKKKGLDGIAITDHDTTSGLDEAFKLTQDEDFIVIPGIEVSSKDGHILGLGIEEKIPKDLQASSTVEKIRKKGGVAVAAHPFSMDFNPFSPLKSDFDAIEVFNSRRYIGNKLARKYVDEKGVPVTGGSDAHFCDEIGLAGVRVDTNPRPSDVLKKIKKGDVRVFGRYLPPLNYIRKIFFTIFG